MEVVSFIFYLRNKYSEKIREEYNWRDLVSVAAFVTDNKRHFKAYNRECEDVKNSTI